LGYVIGVGVSQEDSYQLDRGIEYGQIVMLTLLKVPQISDASQILAQVNFEAKSHSEEVPA